MVERINQLFKSAVSFEHRHIYFLKMRTEPLFILYPIFGSCFCLVNSTKSTSVGRSYCILVLCFPKYCPFTPVLLKCSGPGVKLLLYFEIFFKMGHGWLTQPQCRPLDPLHLESFRRYKLFTCFCVVRKCRCECASVARFGVQNSF